jgi:hypothetical protein
MPDVSGLIWSAEDVERQQKHLQILYTGEVVQFHSERWEVGSQAEPERKHLCGRKASGLRRGWIERIQHGLHRRLEAYSTGS